MGIRGWGGGGGVKVKILEAKYEVKLEFPGGSGEVGWGGGGGNKKPLVGGVWDLLDILSNCTLFPKSNFNLYFKKKV